MEKRELKIVWLKSCVRDFKDLKEEEFIYVENKLRRILSNLIQSTSRVEGTRLRRLRIGKKRLFLGIIENDVCCVGYKYRGDAYNKNKLKEMDRIMKNLFFK